MSAVPYTAPSAPRALKVKVAAHRARLRWEAPASTHGAAVTGYVVQYAACTFGAQHCVLHSKTVTARSLTLGKLAHAHVATHMEAILTQALKNWSTQVQSHLDGQIPPGASGKGSPIPQRRITGAQRQPRVPAEPPGVGGNPVRVP